MLPLATHPSGAHFSDIDVLAQSVSVDLVALIEEYRTLPRNRRDTLIKGVRAFFRQTKTGYPVDVVKTLDQALVTGSPILCPFTGILLSEPSSIHLRRALRLLWKNEGLRPTQDLIPAAKARLRASGSPGRFSGALLRPFVTRDRKSVV